MSLRRAYTAEEYVHWVQQAVFEAEDLRACFEYDLEDELRFPAYLEPLQQTINELLKIMQDGNYSFGREDLPFMDLVNRFGDEIPFSTLLKQINETHRHGLEVASS
ncbi:general secretion pathway protein GspF [Achromatium sp. WMS1]|nr:general secretion pathway protein GspF [Achromatium sp. WMS1]